VMTLTEAEIAGICEKLANWSYAYMCKAWDSANDRELVEFTACAAALHSAETELRLAVEKHAIESMSPESGGPAAGEPEPATTPATLGICSHECQQATRGPSIWASAASRTAITGDQSGTARGERRFRPHISIVARTWTTDPNFLRDS
jgi:hypothetical protein